MVNRGPESGQMDLEIRMDQLVPGSRDRPPGNIGILLLYFRRDMLRCFTNNLESMDDSKDFLFIARKRVFIETCHEGKSLSGRSKHVLEIHLVIPGDCHTFTASSRIRCRSAGFSAIFSTKSTFTPRISESICSIPIYAKSDIGRARSNSTSRSRSLVSFSSPRT